MTPFRLADIAAEKSGAFVGVSGDLRLRMDEKFRLVRAFRSPSLPLPLERLQKLQGVYALPDLRGLYVFAANGFSVFNNSPVGSSETVYVPSPPELDSVQQAASENIITIIQALKDDPGRDVLEIPQIRAALTAARSRL